MAKRLVAAGRERLDSNDMKLFKEINAFYALYEINAINAINELHFRGVVLVMAARLSAFAQGYGATRRLNAEG
jgi:hypothetical protein